MRPQSANPAPPSAPAKAPGADVPFGVNEVRLSGRQWLVVALLVAAVTQLVPWLWEKWERFEVGADYRIPYSLSRDYWLYHRRLRQVQDAHPVFVLGDSVVWGEYVLPDGTLSHFLNQEAGSPGRFVNAGVNGLFPLALEGLLEHYGQPLRHRKVILHCNVLWLTSPKADLSSEKEEQFNHARLVPQFSPRLPCYRADANTRLTAVVERNVRFLGWINHLQNAYFDQKSILNWTLTEDTSVPPHLPNAWKNPLAQIQGAVPSAPAEDPQRGPRSPRHKPWTQNGSSPTRFEWVDLDRSLQWQAVQRLLLKLRERGNEVLVVLGPFNESMIAEENRAAYRKIVDGIKGWLNEHQFPLVAPEPLPSALYADASHPLTEGYEQLAHTIYTDATFQKWRGDH